VFFQILTISVEKKSVAQFISAEKQQILWLGSKFREPWKTVVPNHHTACQTAEHLTGLLCNLL